MTAPEKPLDDGTENILKFAKRAKPCPDCKRSGYVTRYPVGKQPCTTCKGIGVVDGGEPTPGQIGLVGAAKEALLTSKPEPVAEKCPTCGKKYAGDDSDATESMLIANGQRCNCKPVAPVRKWGPKDEVGKLGPGEMFNDGGMLYFEDLSPEVQDALNGRNG
jgi:ribosomal protein L37AE/L43A